MFTKNWIFYTHDYNENSGGSSVFHKICVDMHKRGFSNFFLAPLFCRGDAMIDYRMKPSLKITDRHGRSRIYIEDLPDSYFDKSLYPENMRDLIVTREMLEKRDNIAVYGEGFLGNPLEQRYSVRWIMYFPTPGLPVEPTVPFEKNDRFLVWDLAYFKNIDVAYVGLNDGITYETDTYPDEKDVLFGSYAFLHNMIDLDAEKYKNLPNRKGSCYLIRKADPNYNRTFKQNWNWGTQYNSDHPYGKPKPPVYIHPEDSTKVDTYGLKDLIDIFKQKKYFYCYDHYTFINCIALLYGCTVIMCPPENKSFSKEDWHCGCEAYLDYMAWGDSKEEISKAEELNKKINYGDILKTFIKNRSEQLLSSLVKLDNDFKTELNILKLNEIYPFDGTNCKTVDFSSENYYPLYTKHYAFNEFIIDFTFNIYSDNVSRTNLFSFNYKINNSIPNMGPRIEYTSEQNQLSLIMGDRHGDTLGNIPEVAAIDPKDGYIISNEVVENHNYRLRVHYLNHMLNTQLCSKDDMRVVSSKKYKVLFKPNCFKDLVLGKGFNEERYFKGEISNFVFSFL